MNLPRKSSEGSVRSSSDDGRRFPVMLGHPGSRCGGKQAKLIAPHVSEPCLNEAQVLCSLDPSHSTS